MPKAIDPPDCKKPPRPPSALLTLDTFIAAVPTGPGRCVLVYRRRHSGKEYVRWRTWHRHRIKGVWYPDKRRAFVVPLAHAADLGRAIMSASEGHACTPQPEWLENQEARVADRAVFLRALNAPADMQAEAQRQTLRARGME